MAFVRSFVVITAVAMVMIPIAANAAGRRSARLLDALTGEPVEGAVIVVIWTRHRPGEFVQCWGEEGYQSHAELVTDAEGHFTIPLKLDLTPPFYCPIQEPKLMIFKAAYGAWALQNRKEATHNGASPVYIVWPLRTVDERLAYMKGGWWSDHTGWKNGVCCWEAVRGPDNPHVPYEEIPLYDAAVNTERILLGLAPFGFGVPTLLYDRQRGI
jgi:hypothetical protein